MKFMMRMVRALLLGVHLMGERFTRLNSPKMYAAQERLIEKKRKKERLYKKGKRRRIRSYKRPHLKINRASPKDSRFSNQRSLRRMFRNS